jgi:hypothetical protein
MPVSATRALDPDALVDGAARALRANATIAAALDIANHPERVASGMVEQGATPPYIVLALPSVVYASPYGAAALNCLMDVSIYTQGSSTRLVRQLLTACLAALVDTAWTAAGFAIWSVNMEEAGSGLRAVDAVEPGGAIIRGRQATLRIRAAKA